MIRTLTVAAALAAGVVVGPAAGAASACGMDVCVADYCVAGAPCVHVERSDTPPYVVWID